MNPTDGPNGPKDSEFVPALVEVAPKFPTLKKKYKSHWFFHIIFSN